MKAFIIAYVFGVCVSFFIGFEIGTDKERKQQNEDRRKRQIEWDRKWRERKVKVIGKICDSPCCYCIFYFSNAKQTYAHHNQYIVGDSVQLNFN